MNSLYPEKRVAVFSDDRAYRYTLEIVWDAQLPLCQFIGLNPSTADEFKDDPTVRRCKGFARREGCGGLVMTNIFAFRDTDPRGMLAHPAPIGERLDDGERNDWHLMAVARRCKLSIAAWGTDGEHLRRGLYVARDLFRVAGISLLCLGVTKGGHPKHPLYLSKTSPLVPFVPVV